MKKNFIIFLCIVSFTFNISKSNAQTNTLTDVQSTIGSASSGWLFEPAQADANHFFDVINTTRTGLQRFGFNMSVEEAIYDYAANNGSLNFAKLDVWCKAGASRNILLSCLVDYYWTDGVWGRHTNPVASYNWYNIGRNLALRYAPNSSWWTSQGISNYGLTNYALFNEPDEYNSGNGITDGPKTISSTDYHNALQQFANGVHSVSSTLQVFAGGWAWKDQNINTYAPYIMDLISNGTLNGINQHMYVGNYPWEIDNFNNYSWTPQGMYQFFVNQYNLPASAKFITDEMNVNADVPNADSRFCSYVWNTLGITNANGQPAFGNVCEVYSVFEGESEANLSLCWNGRTNVQDPWLGNGRGRCLQMISNLTTGMSFTSVDARRTFGGTTTGTGKYILDGGGKRLWVWHNKNNWTNATGTSFTCTGIPAGTVKIDVYRYNSCSQTVGTTGTLVPYATATISGQTSYTFTGLPADETLMFKSTTGTASWIAIDDNAPGWTYNNGFNYDGGCTSCFNMTNHETNTSNKSATVSFTGTAVELYCEAWSGAGSVKVYIDGVLKGTYSQNITPAGGAKLFATISGLSDASHTLKITSSSNSWVSIDYIRYYSITANLSRTSLVTGTKSNIDNAVLIYPNPVSRGGNIYIDLSAYKTVKDKVIQIVDLSGKVVYKRTVNSTIKNLAINASRFSKGFYNILVRDSNTTCTRKLIVQ
jgi:Secretion system C-terminal sorting domain